MIDVDNQPDLEDVLSALSSPVKHSKPVKKDIMPPGDDLSDDAIYQFVIEQLKETITSNAEALEQSKDMVTQTGDAMILEAHSKMVKSQTDLLGKLMSTVMDRKKLEQSDKHKTRDLDLKERAINEKTTYDGLPGGTVNVQNNYLLANRDDLFDSLYEKDQAKKEKAQLKIKEANGITIDDGENDK